MLESGNSQMRHREPREAGLRPSAYPGRALVADLSARSGRCARKRCDRGRMVVSLNLHQHVCLFGTRDIASVGRRVEAARDPAFHHRCVVGVCDHRALWIRRVGMANHREQRLRLPDAIDDPVGVEDLVPAVL
jgi:hypothetical protein